MRRALSWDGPSEVAQGRVLAPALTGTAGRALRSTQVGAPLPPLGSGTAFGLSLRLCVCVSLSPSHLGEGDES